MRNYRTLASYRIVPDGYGLNDKLTLNAQHFVKKDDVWEWDWGGDWGLAATITHELAHEKQKHWGDTPPDHGKSFRNLLLELGIFCTPNGSHYQPAEEGKPFAILMHRLGIKRTDNGIILPEKSKVSYWESKDERKKRGKSTLHPWICPECGQKLGATIKGDIDSTHDACGECCIDNPKIGRKAVCYAKHGEGQRTRKPRVIYEASDYEEEERENTPPIIAALNEISKEILRNI